MCVQPAENLPSTCTPSLYRVCWALTQCGKEDGLDFTCWSQALSQASGSEADMQAGSYSYGIACPVQHWPELAEPALGQGPI